jgi:hypothetical protein
VIVHEIGETRNRGARASFWSVITLRARKGITLVVFLINPKNVEIKQSQEIEIKLKQAPWHNSHHNPLRKHQ